MDLTRFCTLIVLSAAVLACAGRQPTVSGSLVRFSTESTERAPYRHELDLHSAGSVEDLARSLELRSNRLVVDEPVLSRGDRIRVLVAHGEVFSGIFEVGQSGYIDIPFLPRLRVIGLSVDAVGERLESSLVEAGHYRRQAVKVSVQPRFWAPVDVAVSGSVFDPGVVRLSGRSAEERQTYDEVSSGDAGADRTVANAVRAAGGIRPDADLARVVLLRGETVRVLDLSGLVSGTSYYRAFLAGGDRVIVPSTGRIDPALVTLSKLTPPGIRVFLSNLTVPADSNTESAINEHATKLPYGSRLSHALFSANCIGGTSSVNASRVAVLVGQDLISEELRYLEVPVEEVIRNPASSLLNPALLPNDAVGCYDSRLWDLRDLARTASDLLNPFRTISEIARGPRY